MYQTITFFKANKQSTIQPGIIIFLNGSSSSGKTSVARALQDIFNEPYLHVGIDTWLSMLPSRFWGPGSRDANKGFEWIETADNKGPLVTIKVGPWGEKLVNGSYYALASLASQGNNIINDDVVLREETLKQAVKALLNYRVYFIGVQCDLTILQEREKARGDRALNMARAQYEQVHKFCLYDLVINTSHTKPYELAHSIKQYVETHKPNAIFQLARRYKLR